MDWAEGDLVWFDPGVGHPIPGEIQEVHRAAQVIVVQAMIKGKAQTFALQPGEGSLRARQDLGSSGVEDMTLLDDLHEASLLWNLRLRYDKGLIYTFAGSILIAVNPYKMFPDAYGLEVAKQYAGRPLGALPPHLFAIGAAAHAALPSPQVVVISGESGSGKTESTKLVMQYLAAVVPGGGSASAVITEQILEAAPLLEAFGNARTARNDNSSRFGKYLEVYFKSGAIVGAKITQYLLEKSRIVTQAPGERNYHVFYEMLGGLSETERAKYGLLEADKYFYLNQGATDCASGRVDWASLLSAMQVLGVTEGEREGIVRVLAAVLHLGNVYFHRRQLRHGQEGVEIGSDAEIKWAAHLLHISAEGMHRALTSRTTEARAERLHTPLGIDQALDARDAFAKALYAGLFNWLVSRINSIVQKGGTHDAHRISILDIFGFEDLAENSFEQLCINYANENLQLYFNKHVFKLEQAEYARERLEWTPLAWDDNLPVIHLLAKKPVGICHLLDDESNFPRATDLSFLEKCHYNHALSELYARPRIGAQEFGVTHYAGQVWYCVDGFLDKNRDALRGDVLELLATSRLPLVSELTKQLRAQRDAGKTLPKGSNGRFVTMKPRTPTVAARFADSLQQLLQSMGRCHPWFVRCIKPNQEKQPLRMDMPCVLQQLRYLGMLDTIQIRQRGYPVRLRFQHFVERYRHLLSSPLARGTPYRELCRLLLEAMPRTGVEGPDYQLGATRVFLREALHRALESGRTERLRQAAVHIQRHVRGMLVRRQLTRRQAAATRLQARWRGQRQQQRFEQLRHGARTAQRLWRGKQARRRVQQLRSDHRRRQEAREAAQRAREAREAKQAVLERSQLSYLDIPAELAFIYSKLQGWTPPHNDRHLVKVLGTVPGPPAAGAQLPPDLAQFSFGKFSSVYCNGLRLQPRREPITAPLLTRAASRDQDFQDALAVFKLILRWSNDKALEGEGAKEKLLSDYIVHKALSSRGLRDEILVQLCNQLHGAEPQMAARLWQLLGQCLCCFQPSAAFSKYLLKFVSDEAPPSPTRQLLQRQLLRQQTNSPGGNGAGACRSFVPAWIEWRAWSRGCDMALPLTLPDEASQTVAVDSWTSCEEAAALAVSTLGVASRGWTLVLDDGQQLTDSCGLDYVMDLIAEKELCPAFPAPRSDLLRSGANKDPSETRHFLDPYGRAKTVRIGKWRWPPPQGEPQFQTEEDFFAFKLRQQQRKTTPQSQHSANNATAIEWEEFEIESCKSVTPPGIGVPLASSMQQLMRRSMRLDANGSGTGRDLQDLQVQSNQAPAANATTTTTTTTTITATKLAKKSFEIGADRPPPGSVGKLKLSSEMRQRLEQVTAGHSVRSTVSNKSEQRAPAKLEDTRKLMLQQQLGGLFASANNQTGNAPTHDSMATVRTQIERMEGKLSPPPPAPPSAWMPNVLLPPAPSVPAPPPPIRPPSMAPPAPPPAPQSPSVHHGTDVDEPEPDYRKEHVPAFIQRQERDTFGAVRQPLHHLQQQQQQQHGQLHHQSLQQQSMQSLHHHQQHNNNHHHHHQQQQQQQLHMQEQAWQQELQAERERSRSRSRSRDREDYSESVWDRAEVEGPASGSGSEKEREKRERERERLYELRQVEREKESHKVYQPAPPRVIQASLDTAGSKVSREREHSLAATPATFRTHMAQKYEHERKRKSSASSAGVREDLLDASMSPVVVVPAPVPPPPVTPTSSSMSASSVVAATAAAVTGSTSSGAGASACLTYNRVPWKLRVRKEVFQPHEPIGPPVALDLLFAQVLSDVFGVTPCLRITPQEKNAALNMLHGHGVSVDTLAARNQQVRALVKRHLVDMARDWPLYFARLFAVQGAPLYPDVSIMGVSHSGLYLARRDADYLIVVQAISFAEIQNAVTLPRPAALQLNLRNGKHLALHATRAAAIQSMITGFVLEYRKSQSKASTLSSGARAAAQTLNVPLDRLEPRQAQHAQQQQRNEHAHSNGGGDATIEQHHLQQQQVELHHQQQQQQQLEDGADEEQLVEQQRYIKQQSYLHSNAARKSNAGQQQQQQQQPNSLTNGHQQQQQQQQQQHDLDGNYMLQDELNGNGTPPSVTKYSLLQFAMQHFRNDQLRDADRHHERHQSSSSSSAANRSYAELVKWQGHAIRLPLLRLPNDLAPLALECFDCILRYCGDIPLDPELTEVKCVYTVLMHCHKYLALRDEVYCQLMKQTTANRSPCPDSSQRAWRLLSILAAYFGCSDALRPYLMEHLTSAASDRRRSCHGTAAVCLTNLRKTARCGGRKNVPSVEEVTAVSAGRSARRQIYRLPGGAERVVNTRCSTVVADVIAELCALLGVESEAEQQEFSLYCIVQGDAFTMPLAADEYILDVTTELLKSGQPFYLIFCRSVWHFALKREPAPMPLYVEVLFNQVAPDYLEGLLLELPGNGVPMPEMVRDMARIAALLHRAADLSHVPAMKEIKFLLPKPALGIREIRPAQWVGLVQSAWPQVANLSPGQVKAQFLNVLAAWPLFGSSFFAVKRIWAEEGPHVEDNHNPMWRDLILALNRRGVLFLDPNTHETLQHWSFMEVISTRKVRSEDGALFLDMKVGNLMQQRVIRVQTEQAHEISRLVRQYITMAQISQRDKRELN
ncbi:GH17916 [Drosophila grimshawi]|uniref:GH17916 n=1 Tax=Drosophila grimshawi TaxID=7222 RepID=B4JXB1_DROGR|nr:GH17916 [Drosophila grimshawi]